MTRRLSRTKRGKNKSSDGSNDKKLQMIESFSKYKIIEKLGSGGMGEVYKAEDQVLLRTVAIKIIAKQNQRTPEAERRFLREARAASALNHPNIVIVYEIGETDEQAYIVMEYVKGRSLRDLLILQALRPEAIIKASIQICDALAEAHSHGIIHRDIKPENILLTERGQVKLLDFGVAKAFKGAGEAGGGATAIETLTQSGAVMGTLSYMSPEQLRGEPLDERSDIFSFGIVLYEMLTGKLPFQGASSLEVAASILKDAATEINSVPEGMPRGIILIVMRCLSKNIESRYSSFDEIRQDIESLKQDSAQQSRGVDLTLALEPKPDEQSKIIVRTSAAQFWPKPPARPTILVLPLEAVGSDETASYIGIGLAHAITTDLAKIEGLSVLSKSAGAGRIDRVGREARDLARELGATILLEGEVMRAGQMMGIMARLTDAQTGRVIWGAQYRGDAADLFSIQDAVCESVAAAFKVSISNEARSKIARPATTNLDAFEFYSKGRAFLERREVKENIDFAIQMFGEALKLDPNFSLAQAGLGEAYWLKYEATRDNTWVDCAIAASNHALKLDPYQAQVHVSLGIVYHGTGKTDKAIEEFERAIDLQPLSDDAYRWMGRCYMQKGDQQRAVGYFKKAIEIRPGYWDNYNLLGFCYYTFGDYREAAEQFRRVIVIQPDNYRGYDTLGVIYILLGRYEESVAMHQRAIEIYPNFKSQCNLGTAYFYLERYEEAIAAYKVAINLDPRDDRGYCGLGDAYLRTGNAEEAQEQFKRASDLLEDQLNVNPENAELLGRLALYQARLRQAHDALVNIERATTLEPHNTTLMYQKAVVYALAGYTDKAIDYLGRALASGYSRAEAERDPALESLRGKPEYEALFTS